MECAAVAALSNLQTTGHLGTGRTLALARGVFEFCRPPASPETDPALDFVHKQLDVAPADFLGK